MKDRFDYKQKEYTYTPEEKQEYWDLGIGLQAVDDLKPSKYLLELISENVAGKLSIDDIEAALKTYYKNLEDKKEDNREADIVSARIVKYLQEREFTLHPLTLKTIHKALFCGFEGVDAGNYKKNNFSKGEPILNGFSVRYEDFGNVEDFIEYDIKNEKKKDYNSFTDAEKVKNISGFISGIWQIHPFNEGNTRTTAVFAIQYLNTLGFDVSNTPFKDNSKYFRDALVRANFSDVSKGISSTNVFLERFFESVMFAKEHAFDSADLIVPQLFKG